MAPSTFSEGRGQEEAQELKGVSEKLLLINDESTALKALSRILGRRYEVQAFLDPVEAWKYLEEGGNADVVVTDLYMPELDGILFTRFLKNSASVEVSSIPVIVSSTIAGGEDIEELAVQTGAAGFLGLPMRPGELLDSVHDIVRGDFSGPQMDVAFLTSHEASPLVESLRPLLQSSEFRVRTLEGGVSDPEELIDVEFVVLSDDLKNVEETLTQLSSPGRAFVLIVFSLSTSSAHVQRLMEYGADAVINSAFSKEDFLKTMRLCTRQRAWYRIMERRHRA